MKVLILICSCARSEEAGITSVNKSSQTEAAELGKQCCWSFEVADNGLYDESQAVQSH